MSVRNVMFSAFGVFGVLETVFVAFALTDASLCIIKTYPTFVLISFATILSLLIVFIGISIWLFGLFRKTPGPACEVIECLDEQVGMHHKKETERLRHTLSGEGESLPPQLPDEAKACQALTELQRDQKRKEELEILRRKCALAGIGDASMSVNNGAAGESVDAAMRESVQTAMSVLERIKVPSVPTIRVH